MKANTLNVLRTGSAIALLGALAACGGGGGGSSNSGSGSGNNGTTTTPNTPTPSSVISNTTVGTAQYASGSVESAVLTTLNQARQSCGFPALQENTLLDTASANHAKYEGVNNTISDTESSGSANFTGVSYVDRAVAAGFPANTVGAGVSASAYTAPASTNTQYGNLIANEWLGGVYHGPAVMVPSGVVGVGSYQTTYNGLPQVWASVSLLNLSLGQTSSNGPLTYPCQGTTGVFYSLAGESPTPPNTSGAFGTPITVMGNPTDTIVLTSGTLSSGSGSVALQLLDSAKDSTNKVLAPYMASAYPVAPLTPSTTYTASITGTVNGVAFSRSFSFTTAASE
jgi:uncharacterized protein YkwD